MSEEATSGELTLDAVAEALTAMGVRFEKNEGGIVGGVRTDDARLMFQIEVKDARVTIASMLHAVPRDKWAELLVDLNDYHRRSYRPKLYLPVDPAKDAVPLMAEELLDADDGCTAATLQRWLRGHFAASLGAAKKLGGSEPAPD